MYYFRFSLVNNPASSLSVTASATDLSCNEVGSGQITATGTSSSVLGGYTLWTVNGDSITTVISTTTETFTGLDAGEYAVFVADAGNCFSAATVTVSEPSELMVSASTVADVTCNGDSDGQATATPAGGTAGSGYSYMWSNNESTANATSLTAGNATVTVYDGNGCMTTESVVVGEPTAVSMNTSSDDISCNGLMDGSIDVIASGGGVGGYIVSWDNGLSNGANQTNLGAATYGITVTDGNNCSATGTATIADPTALSVSLTATEDFVCFGETNGAATASATGGTGSISYTWTDNGSTNNTNNTLAPGSHGVTVTDANGCSATSNSIVVTEGSSAVQVNVTGTNETCISCDDGTATANASGGTSPYTYGWNVAGTGSTVSNLDPLCDSSSIYSVIVTDANGCTATDQVNLFCGPNAITELSTLDNMNIYPNPTNGFVNVALSSTTAGKYSFTVRNVIGQTINTSTETIHGSYIKLLDLSDQSEGIYFLTVKSESSEKTAKIIVR